MTSTYTARGLSLVALFLLHVVISVEAFDLHHPSGPRSVNSRLHPNEATKELNGAVKLEGRHHGLCDENDACSSSKLGSNAAAPTSSSASSNEPSSRNQFLLNCRTYLACGLAASASSAAAWSGFPEASNAKSYSENAANFERLNNGDFSGGAVFDNNPTTERAKKRRAMTGCKIKQSREEASIEILKRDKTISESECNIMVMDGDTEFMLRALRNLDCPTCANGIGEKD